MKLFSRGLLCALAACVSASAAPGVYTVLSGTGLVSMPSSTVIATQAAIGGGYYNLAADSSGNYYIPIVSGLKKVTPGGVVTTLATAPGTSQWISADVDASGNIIVADNQQHEIWRISPSGSTQVVVASYASCSMNLDDVYIRIDGSGNYVIASDLCSGTSIFRMTPAGVVTTLSLSPTIPSNVGGLTINTSGNYVIAGYSANTVYQITPAGAVTTVAGPSAALSHNIFCIAYDPGAQNYVVCSAADNTLLAVTPAGGISTLFTDPKLAGGKGVIVTTPGTPPTGVPTTPAPSALLLTMTALLAACGWLLWKRRTA